jgi:hypothetical protein
MDVEEQAMSKPDSTRARWRKSSRSNGEQACVELAAGTSMTVVRDSKNAASGALVLDVATWHAFRCVIKSGGLDTPGA